MSADAPTPPAKNPPAKNLVHTLLGAGLPAHPPDALRRLDKAAEIKGLTTTEELWMLSMLARLAQSPDKGAGVLPIVELGTFQGRSAAALCVGAASDSHVISLDTYVMQHHGEASRQAALAGLYGLSFRPVLLECDSLAAGFHRVRKAAPLAMVFLDTDHREEHVTSEIQRYAPLVAPGGILCVHDYGHARWAGVKAACDTYFSRYEVTWRSLGVGGLLAAWQRRRYLEEGEVPDPRLD